MYPSKTHCAMFDFNKKDITSKATTVAQDRLGHAAKPKPNPGSRQVLTR